MPCRAVACQDSGGISLFQGISQFWGFAASLAIGDSVDLRHVLDPTIDRRVFRRVLPLLYLKDVGGGMPGWVYTSLAQCERGCCLQ